MDIKRRLRNWLGVEEHFSLGNPDIRQRIIMVGNSPIYMYDFGGFNVANADRKDPNLSRSIDVIGDSIAGLPIKIKRRIITGGDEEFEPADDHEAALLLRRPNTLIRTDEMIRHIIQSLIMAGNGYWFIDLKGNRPQAIWPMIPGCITVKYNNLKIPIGYTYRNSESTEITLPLEAVIHFKLYHMRTPFEGKDKIEPIREELATNEYALTLLGNKYQEGILSDQYFVDNTLAGLGEDQRKQFSESLHAAHGGIEKGGKSPLLPQGIDVKSIPRSLTDMVTGDTTKMNREQIYGALGVPPTIGGVDEYASYANATIEAQNFWVNTNIPFISIIQLTLKHQYLDRFYSDDDLETEFDTSKVAALQENTLQKAQRESIQVRSGLRTINELRADDGLPAVAWGNEPPAVAAVPTQPEDQSNPQKQSYGIESFIRRPMDRVSHCFAFDASTKRAEDKYLALLRIYFRDQRKRVMAALNTVTGGGRFMASLYFAKKHNPTDIFNVSAEDDEIETFLSPELRTIVKSAGVDALRRARIAGSFSVNNPRVAEIIAGQINRSKLINDTTFDDIKRVLADAYDENWSHSQLIKEINDLYGEYGYTRSELIARSEMASVANAAAVESYQQNGIEKIEWLASIDERTREAHAAADGQVVDVGQPFMVGGEMLKAPGDPAGSAENTINCRCTVIPVLAAEQ
jgi:HK97 family phage portal protein